MRLVKSGKNWEVRERFISAREADAAARQALGLIESKSSCLEELDPVKGVWSGNDMRVFRVQLDRLIDAMRASQGLLSVYGKTESQAQNRLGEFFLNLYEPHGSTAKHRDDYEVDGTRARSTIAVGLAGVGEVSIEDPTSGQEHTATLNPGDSLHLRNVPDLSERPLHVVRNTLEIPRLALVNG